MTLPLKLPSNLPSELQSVPIVDLSTSLPVNPKYTWAERGGVRNLNALTTFAYHHDAWPKHVSAKYTDAQLAREIAGDHIRSVKNIPGGDPGFPYHAWIRNGTLYVCNHLEWRLYGVSNRNADTVHICVSGDYANHDALMEADRRALYAAYFLFKQALPNCKEIKGHKELSSTVCPGYDMEEVREDIMTIEQQMEQAEAPQKQEEIAYRMANHVLYLQNMSRGKTSQNGQATPEQQKWALSQLLKLEPEFRRLGFLK